MFPSRLVFTVAVAAAHSIAHAEPTWKSTLGPPGGSVSSLDAEGEAAVIVTPVGVFTSADAGDHWSGPFRPGFASPSATRVAMAGGVVFASGGGELWASHDLGATWANLFLPPGALSLDAARRTASGRLVVMSGLADPVPGAVFFSDDDGETWSGPAFVDPTVALEVRGDEILTLTLEFGFVGTINYSADAGQTWTVLAGGFNNAGDVSGFGLRDVGFLGDTAIGAFGTGSYLSTPAPGGLWSEVFLHTVTGGDFWNPQFHHVDGAAYLLAYRADAGNPMPGDTWYIWRTSDGAAWTRLDTDGFPAAFSPSSEWVGDGERLYVGAGFGLYASPDRAENFALAMEGIDAAFTWALTATDQGIVANVINTSQAWRLSSPQAPWIAGAIFENDDLGGTVLEFWSPGGDTIFAGHLTDGVTRSVDGGVTWDFARTGIAQYNGTAGLQFREIQAFTRTGNTYLAGSGHGLEARSDGGQGFQLSGGGVFRSANGGASWSASSTGLPIIGRDSFFQPLFDPILAMHASGSTVLASHQLSGLSRSLNAGVSWARANTGLPRTDSGALPVITDFAEAGGSIFAALQFTGSDAWGVFRSSDGGATWTASRDGLPRTDLMALAFHQGRLYAGTGNFDLPRPPFADPEQGVYVSDDLGLTWRRDSGDLDGISVRDFAAHRGTLYVGTFGAGVWALTSQCASADLTGASDPNDPAYGVPDGAVDAADFFYYLDQFVSGNLAAADLTGASDPNDPAYGLPDGALDAADFFYYLDRFVEGCR